MSALETHGAVQVEDHVRTEDEDTDPVEHRHRALYGKTEEGSDDGGELTHDQDREGSKEWAAPALEAVRDHRTDHTKDTDHRSGHEEHLRDTRRRVEGDDRTEDQAERNSDHHVAHQGDDRVVAPKGDEDTHERHHEGADESAPPELHARRERRSHGAHTDAEHGPEADQEGVEVLGEGMLLPDTIPHGTRRHGSSQLSDLVRRYATFISTSEWTHCQLMLHSSHMNESGFLLINKPEGITSFGAITALRKKTGVKKIGHAGTLDPFATGLLIIAVGREATREIQHFVKQDKVYEAEFCFGATTETLDTEGEVQKNPNFKPEMISAEKIQEILPSFTGEIMQAPPAFSAMKINGKRAYKLARKGEGVEIPERPITINKITVDSLEEHEGLTYANFTIDCGSGTYIRSLARDIAKALGTEGYVTKLHRTSIGPFLNKDAHALEEIDENWKNKRISAEKMLANIGKAS